MCSMAERLRVLRQQKCLYMYILLSYEGSHWKGLHRLDVHLVS